MGLAEEGQGAKQILAQLAAFKADDVAWRNGRVFAFVFNAGQDAEALVKQAQAMYLSENALDPTSFPSTLRLEREIVRLTAGLMQGDSQVVGNVTSGGTESIMLAVKTARDWARAQRPQIKEPEMILCHTAHAAFHKAAHYLGLKPVIVPFEPDTYKADVEAMREAINENTILLVASAPNYSHGIVDPVPRIAALAANNNLLCHVDACIGGIQLAFMRRLGYEVPPFDFAVPGVTSLSVDPHKYGYSAKGSSVILYRDRALRRYQIYANLSTTAYAIVNPTIQSTKSGGPLAATWAIMHYFGQEGYRKIAGEVIEAARKMMDGIRAMPDLRIEGRPDMSLFAFSSDTLNVYQLAEVMRQKGWYLQPQFSKAGGRPNLHLTVSHSNVPFVDEFLADLAAAVAETKRLEHLDPQTVREQVSALLQGLTTAEAAQALYQLAGMEDGELPEDMAFVNTVLDALPPPIAEYMLREFFNDLYV
ncbi:MAG: pyridoxal phosphate-dependent decarboxylase family protein [Candidatus Promineifilaceae bacterium]